MQTPRPEQIPCDGALRLLSRSLDGDLTRAETRQLYLHLAACDACRIQMAEMAMLASHLTELNRHYAGQSLDAMFLEKVQEAVRRVEQERPTQDIPSQVTPQRSHFHVHEVQLYSAQDNVEWTHTQLVPPRDTVRLVVHHGHHQAYHFRLESWGPVPIMVTHEEADGDKRSMPQFILQGIRYAFLQSPQPGDAIMVRNEGEQPIHVSVAARHPDALMVWILRHNSPQSPVAHPHSSSREDQPSPG